MKPTSAIKKITMPENDLIVINTRVEQLYQKISPYIDNARKQVQRSIDTEMVTTHWLIGRDIVEEEQHIRSSGDSFSTSSLCLALNIP